MFDKIANSLIAIGLGMVLLVMALVLRLPILPVSAAPALAPEIVRIEALTLNSSTIATTTNFGGDRWSARGIDDPPTVADIFLFVDIDASVNTTTFVLQVSPDGATWVNHSTASALAANIAVDTNTYTRTTVEGVYYRVTATASNSETLTPTIKVVLR